MSGSPAPRLPHEESVPRVGIEELEPWRAENSRGGLVRIDPAEPIIYIYIYVYICEHTQNWL